MIAALFSLPATLIDLETTGASPTRDRITEIGLIDLDPPPSSSADLPWSRGDQSSTGSPHGAQWSTLVQPGIPIPAFITGLTGIDDTMVKDAPQFAEIASALARRLEGRLLIAHNVRFDYGFLRAEFLRAGIAFSAPVLCSARLSRKLYPQHHRHNLDALIARHGIFCVDRHRAIGDAQVIGEFLTAAIADLGAPRVAEVAQALIAPAGAPRPVLDLIEELPARAGCFVLRAADRSVLYVGSGRDARDEATRLLQRSSALGRALISETVSIDFERHVGMLGAALAQNTLVERLLPRHQRHAAKTAQRESWRLIWQPGQNPEFALMPAADAPTGSKAFGDFPGEPVARAALAAFAREHRLCPPLLGLQAAPAPCLPATQRDCHGACHHPAPGSETQASHLGRALTALSRLPHPAQPPHRGLAGYREVDTEGESEIHLFDGNRYLGAARTPDALAQLLEQRPPAADAPADPRPLQILARVLNTAGGRIERVQVPH